MNKKIVVVGSSNTDMVVQCPHLPKPGETVLGSDFAMNFGGKGANQAVAAAKLGGNVSFIAKLGDDVFGKQTLDMFKNVGIDTQNVTISNEHPSGVALINVDDNAENSISVAPGANAALLPADIDRAKDVIASAHVLLVQLETPVETIMHAAKMAKENGVTVVLNPAPAPKKPLPNELLNNVDIIIPNKTEAEIISGVEITDYESEMKAILEIDRKGVSTTIVTLGSKGAILCEKGDCREIPSVKVKAVDTTAAGDTFCGAFCVALTEGMTLAEAVVFGNKAAAISVTRHGAQKSIPTREEVDRIV